MLYTCQSLQFGGNQKRVPGYEKDLMLSNPSTAPIKEKLVDLHTDNLWDLVFSYESGMFYPAGANVPAHDGGIIKSWYGQGAGGPHSLVLKPFIVAEDETGFVQASNFVDFSENPTTENLVNTDTIDNPTVTAVVHSELSEYEKLEVSTSATNYSVIITTKSTRAVFDRIFVYGGPSMPIANTVTVPKGQNCLALAVFKKVTSCSSEEIGTIQWPKISRWEWPRLLSEIIKDIVASRNGEIYQHLSPKFIVEAEPDVLKKEMSSINKRIEALY
ncbi:hypothetical protein [uncultured Desulfobacter sp.]|uniref:hypothetical protein n=1 Tax=uncultured Desulfobacter sp. TaxID=240139 RepID=UPI0029F56F27|nr:hypothetical protein [uncultured Desulfobacter sp.]